MAGILDFLFGSKEVEPRTDYPSSEDVRMADKYDSTYGDNSARQLGIESLTPTMSSKDIVRLFNNMKGGDDHNKVLQQVRAESDPDRRDYMMRSYIASQRAAIAAIGFDPSRAIVSSDNPENIRYDTAGKYRPHTLTEEGKREKDIDMTMVLRSQDTDPSTMTHESMHRGIEQLIRKKDQEDATLVREKGGIPTLNEDLKRAGSGEQEDIVRALMQKYYGDIETQGRHNSTLVESGSKYLANNPEYLNRLELLAQQYAYENNKNRRNW